MTEDVAFYVELAKEADGPVVELAVGTGRVAIPSRKRSAEGHRYRLLAGHARRAREAGGDLLDLRLGDMRDLGSRSRRRSSTARIGRSSTCRPGRPPRACSSGSPAAFPGGVSPGTRSPSTTRSRRARRIAPGGAASAHVRYAVGDSRSTSCSTPATRAPLVGDEERMARTARRVGPGGRRRSTAGSTGGRSTTRAASSSGSPASSPDDPVRPDRADLRPVEPFGHRGRRLLRRQAALASGGPVVELAVGTGRIAVPIAEAGVRVIGVDSSPEMLAVARRPRRRGRRAPRRPAPRRPPRAAGRRARTARRSARSAHSCTWRPRRRSCARSTPPAALLAPGGRFVFDVFAPSQEDIEETHDRWLEREPGIFERAVWDEGARTLSLSVRSGDGRRDVRAPLALRARVAAAPRRGRLRGGGALRLVRPRPLRRRGGHDLRLPAALSGSRQRPGPPHRPARSRRRARSRRPRRRARASRAGRRAPSAARSEARPCAGRVADHRDLEQRLADLHPLADRPRLHVGALDGDVLADRARLDADRRRGAPSRRAAPRGGAGSRARSPRSPGSRSPGRARGARNAAPALGRDEETDHVCHRTQRIHRVGPA